jgi:phosphatidylserine decarboxylase
LKAYKTFNQFFARQLKPDARPPANPQDPSVVVSSADCRLTVFEDVTTATQIWIKGREFTIPKLLHDDHIEQNPAYASGFALAIFRLAPQVGSVFQVIS